jgi:hypothetical protein
MSNCNSEEDWSWFALTPVQQAAWQIVCIGGDGESPWAIATVLRPVADRLEASRHVDLLGWPQSQFARTVRGLLNLSPNGFMDAKGGGHDRRTPERSWSQSDAANAPIEAEDAAVIGNFVAELIASDPPEGLDPAILEAKMIAYQREYKRALSERPWNGLPDDSDGSDGVLSTKSKASTALDKAAALIDSLPNQRTEEPQLFYLSERPSGPKEGAAWDALMFLSESLSGVKGAIPGDLKTPDLHAQVNDWLEKQSRLDYSFSTVSPDVVKRVLKRKKPTPFILKNTTGK